MSLISFIAALLLQKFRPFTDPDPFKFWVQKLADWVEQYANAGHKHFGILAWFGVITIVTLPVTLIYFLLKGITPVLGLLFCVVVLYLAIRFRTILTEFTLIQRALRQDHLEEARERLGRWLNRPVLLLSKTEIAKASIEYAILNCYRGLFAVLFWFVIIPGGPAGAFFYRAATILMERWHWREDRPDNHFGWFAEKIFAVIDWLPQRLTAISFAIVGDFEDALYCWRSQAKFWPNTYDGIVLAAAAGALGIRLGEPLTIADESVYRPLIGLGDEADSDYMQSAEGLVWRAVVLWLVGLVLLAIMQLIS